MEAIPSEPTKVVHVDMLSLLRDGSVFDFNPAIRDYVDDHATAEGEQA